MGTGPWLKNILEMHSIKPIIHLMNIGTATRLSPRHGDLRSIVGPQVEKKAEKGGD